MGIEHGLRRLVARVENLPAKLVIPSAYVILAVVGWLDHATGPEVAFSFFYLIPILVVDWRLGPRLGLVTTFMAGCVWFLIDYQTTSYSSRATGIYNGLIRFGVLLVVHFSINAVKQARRELEELARIDRLTGLANRNRFVEAAGMQVKLAARRQEGVSLAYVDVDDFKRINDTLGHAAGDEALIAVANVMRESVRETDVCARMGGDEFAIVFSDADAGRAQVALERIREGIAALARQKGWPISLSMGLASFRAVRGLSLDDMLRSADEVMYEAKRGGKDRIHVREVN